MGQIFCIAIAYFQRWTSKKFQKACFDFLPYFQSIIMLFLILEIYVPPPQLQKAPSDLEEACSALMITVHPFNSPRISLHRVASGGGGA